MSAVRELGPKLYTEADLERLSDEGYHYILIDGELRELSPASQPHGAAGQLLGGLATAHVFQHELGETYLAETGFTVARNPDTVLAPDWCLVSNERLPKEPAKRGFAHVVPDLVLEVKSPSSTRTDVREKVDVWLRHGARMVWDLNPDRKILTVYRSGEEPRVLTAADTLTGEDVLPGFSLPLARVFR